ncbi:MAG TPA: dipeptidase [Thermotogota bacterium]|nr:dipeptidase [Thermotogota bacterium]HRW91451.1 dipeptidase [Thermotogota bacterium]
METWKPNGPIVDGHYDFLMDVAPRREKGEQRVMQRVFLEQIRAGGFGFVGSSLFLENEFLPEMALRKTLAMIGGLYEEIDESPGEMMVCTKASDFDSCMQQGKVGFVLAFEGVEALMGDRSLLRVFHQLGVRMVGITWSRRNDAGDGCTFRSSEPQSPAGLTPFGFWLVEECQRLGMVLDISHLNDAGMEDVLRTSRAPVVASHSNARALVDSPRNLTDEQIFKIAQGGGLIGVNSASLFLHSDPSGASVQELAEHLEYLVNRAGEDHVGFGFDICTHLQPSGDTQRDLHDQLPEFFNVLPSHGAVGELWEELARRKWSPSRMEKVAGANWIRLWKQTFPREK